MVFGCTHFGVLEQSVKNVIGRHIKIADGNEGTIRHLTNILSDRNLLNPGDKGKGDVQFHNSGTQAALMNSRSNFETHLKNLEAG